MNVLLPLILGIAVGAVDVEKQPDVANQKPEVVFTQHHNPQPVMLPFEDIGPYDPLPAYTQEMPDYLFQKWAKAQNAMAYKKARQQADDWDARNPALDTYVQINDYVSTSDLDQMESATSRSAKVDGTSRTNYNGHSIQMTYRDRNRWGGGPVTIINPYCRARFSR